MLLPKTATAYTPDSINGETATITYRAWDTVDDHAGDGVDLSGASALGDRTSFSLDSDSPTLTVTDVNDSPVLTAAKPSLGSIFPGNVKSFSFGGNDHQPRCGHHDYHRCRHQQRRERGWDCLGRRFRCGNLGILDRRHEFSSVKHRIRVLGTAVPENALLRYTSILANGTETASITYRAWDHSGSNNDGDRVDLSQVGAVGGITSLFPSRIRRRSSSTMHPS